MSWGAILGGIAGGIGGFFLGGPATAVAVGSQVYNAVNAGQAASKGAKQEVEGAKRSEAAYAPFVEGGTQAFNTLSGLAGLGPMAGGGPLPPPSARSRPADAPIVGNAVPRMQTPDDTPMTLSAFSRRGLNPGDPTAQAPKSSYGGGTVLLMAPNGARMAVPAETVEHYIQRGARQVEA